MILSGLAYLVMISIGYALFFPLLSHISPDLTITPGYWEPKTLFNLGKLTGGYAIEDALFMFLTGGIAAALYEEMFGRHLSNRKAKHRPHVAVATAAVGAIVTTSFKVNLIYALIVFGFVGAAVIWIQRRDLVIHSLVGGLAFLVVYFLSFELFLLIFPHYIGTYYHLHNISGLLLLGVPLEEIMFAFSFGLMWSPIYEYMNDRR